MKAPASVGRCLQILPTSEVRLVTIHTTTHSNTTHKIVHSSCVEKERPHANSKQCTESYVNIYMCIFFIQFIIHIQVVTETEEIGWVMEGTVGAEDYTFLWKNKLSFKDRIFYTSYYNISS